MILGAHCSTSGGVWKALERAHSAGCEVVQIFVKNNMQWRGNPHSAADLAKFNETRRRLKLSAIFGHAGYLINIAAPPSPNRDKSVQCLLLELQFAANLELPFLVLHPGAHLGAGEETGLERAAAALDEVFAATRGSKVKIALENTAGQGSCLGSQLSHLAKILSRLRNPDRVGVCFDTAHFFAAGYDIRSQQGWNKAIKEAEALLGLTKILAFHLNDSKTELGSRVDRHAHIGEGKIGLDGFCHIVNDPRFREHPACIETPKSEDLHEDKKNLASLRGLMRTRPKRQQAGEDTHSGRRRIR